MKLNLVEFKFHSMYLNSIQTQFKLHCNVIHASISYRNELLSFHFKTIWKFFLFHKDIYLFLFFQRLVLAQIRRIYCMLHIVSHYHFLLTKHYLHQSYFNMSCHWHMNMCCLIRIYVNILRLFKRLVTKE